MSFQTTVNTYIKLSLLLAFTLCQSMYSKKAPPNIILIMTDDQGYGDLACLGNPLIKTPNIDKFHTESVHLIDYHVSPTCAPTRGALLCGQVTDKAGPWHTINGRNYLRKEKQTIPQLLAGNGYATAIFGKWHLGDNYPYRPQDRGFQHTLTHGGGGVGQVPDYFGNDYFDDTYYENGVPKKFEGYCTDIWFSEAIKWIEENKDQPFFAYISTNAPHSPFIVEDRYRDLYPETFNAINVPREFYGMITNIDENFALLEAKLEALNLRQNTILIFTTDNGSSAGIQIHNAGMQGGKNSDFDGGHRVPFFIRWPDGNIGGNKDVEALTAHVDILPTLLAMTNTPNPKNQELDGVDLTPLLKTGEWGIKNRVIVTDTQRVYTPQKWKGTAVMSEHWRLLKNGTKLFNIKSDPAQTNDVSAEHPEIVERLNQSYSNWWNETSPSFEEPTHIIVGTKHENPSLLTSHDWRGDLRDNEVPWHQKHIHSGKLSNGYWEADFATSGTYQISFSRWPLAINKTINDGPGFDTVNRIKAKIDGKVLNKTITTDDRKITFEIKIDAGLKRIQNWLYKDSDFIGGAYYCTVKKI